MTGYLNVFTPNWPHGYVVVFNNDRTVLPFVVKVTDAPGNYPIWGYAVDGNGDPWCFRADGSSCGEFHLRNAAPPKPREWWVNIYQGGTPGVAYATREIADDRRRENRLECIRVREVLDGEDTK